MRSFRKKGNNKPWFGIRQGAGAAVFFLLLFFSPAWGAAQDDPFTVDQGKWKSLESYGSGEQKSVASAPLALPNLPAVLPEEETMRPDRPLNLPTMPGLAQDRTPASTEADSEELSSNEKDLWQTSDRFSSKTESLSLDKQKKSSVHIRLATLPNSRVTPIPADRVTKPLVDRQAQDWGEDKGKSKKPSKLQASPEACEALAAMRRRQLEALESDRKTLADLHKALSELGLTEKLSFMGQADSVPEVFVEQPATSSAPVASESAAAPTKKTAPLAK